MHASKNFLGVQGQGIFLGFCEGEVLHHRHPGGPWERWRDRVCRQGGQGGEGGAGGGGGAGERDPVEGRQIWERTSKASAENIIDASSEIASVVHLSRRTWTAMDASDIGHLNS